MLTIIIIIIIIRRRRRRRRRRRSRSSRGRFLIYKYIITEIQRMCNVQTKVIPLVVGATGTISE